MNRFRPIHFGLLLCALDALWAWQAFGAVPKTAGSNVALVSLIVWSTFHLPAAFLGGLILKPFGVLQVSADALPAWVLLFNAGLGLLQTLLLGWGLALGWRRMRARR